MEQETLDSQPATETATAAPGVQAPVARSPRPRVTGLQGALGNAALARLLLNGRRAVGGGARLARDLSGNPGDIPQGTNEPGTTHAAPKIADAANHAAPAAPAAISGEQSVRLKATADNPLKNASPTLADLYEVAPAAPVSDSAQTTTPGFNRIAGIRGSLTNPIVDEVADDSLYIDPGPTADDVQQSRIGDCWELATFIGIVYRDPGKIRSIIEPDGKGGATISLLYRNEAHGLIDKIFGAGTSPNIEYIPERVHVSNELAFDRSTAPGAAATDRAVRTLAGGKPYSHVIRGAQLRAAPTPKESTWWCSIVGDTLEVHRADVFQMARWAPLMEKAAARFSQVHGAYGGSGMGVGGSAERRDATQGYANIAGGAPGLLLTVFYGKDAEAVVNGPGGFALTNQVAPGTGAGAVLRANEAAFARLLELQGREAGSSRQAATIPIVTAVTRGEDFYVPRFVTAVPLAQADPDWANVPAQAQTDVTATLNACTTWQNAPADPNPLPAGVTNTKTPTRAAMITAAKQAGNPTRNPALLSGRSRAIQAMVDQLLIVKNLGGDTGGGNRSVYAGHAYAVLEVSVVDGGGATVPFSSTSRSGWPALYDRVDVLRSQVKIQNPHHTNEPNPGGGAPADAKDDGVFSVDLDRFFRLYSDVVSGKGATS